MLSFAFLNVIPVYIIKWIVDALNSDKVWPLSQFIWLGLAFVLMFVLKGISYFGQNYLMGGLGQKLIKELRDKLFKKIVTMPITFFNERTTGNLISHITIDLNTLNEAVTIGIVGPLRDIPQIFVLLGAMYILSWRLFLVSIVILPPAAWLITKFGQQNKQVTTKRLNKYGDLTNLLTETITGIRVVKAFNMEDYEIDRFGKENISLFKFFMKSIRIASYSYPILELIGGICAAFILGLGGYLIIHNIITGGQFAGFISAFWLLTPPIKKLNGLTLKIQEGAAAAIRIYSILDSEITIKDAQNAVDLPPIKNEIHIKIDQFCYEKDQTILQDIDIKLKAGCITAIVGASGSGKTTLSNLILRFYDIAPENGFIQIDQYDLAKVKLKSLRNQIAIVTQDVILFNDTVANNISYGDIDCSRDRIVKAARAGYAHEFICALPDGYEQMVGEKGVRLSGGQRQRIAISRALIKNAPILVLDEATSALDTESEKEVQAAIENLMKNRTTLVIAHRLSTIQHADIIHVMKEGRIVESGNHQELLQRNGEYRKLYDIQFQKPKEFISQNNISSAV